MFTPEWIIETVLLFVPLMLSLTVHEFAHARTALAFGDPTALHQGRVSLNPLVHLDPLGTLMLVITHRFGWAKPVPVNPNNLHPQRLGSVMVSLAGPASNLILTAIAAIILRVLMALLSSEAAPPWQGMVFLLLLQLMFANLGLCTFNMLPLFPLDGHHILREFLPPEKQAGFMEWQMKYGRVGLMALILVPILFNRPSPLGWVVMNLGRLVIDVFGLGQIWSYLP